MLQSLNLISVLRYLAGILIAVHGLHRIFFLKQDADYVSQTYEYLFPFESLFQALIVIFPFAEFFIGSLLFLKIATKEAIKLSIWLTLIILFFLIQQGFSSHIVYHLLTLVILFVLSRARKTTLVTNAEL